MSEKRFVPDILVGPSVLEQKDVDAVNRLRRQLALSPEEVASIVDISKGKLTDILCQPNCQFVFFKDPETDEIIGTASLYYHKTFYEPGGTGRVEDVIIDERYRGKGLGKLLMRFIFATARNLRLKTLELTSNPKRVEANKMYLEFGFKKYDTNYYVMDL